MKDTRWCPQVGLEYFPQRVEARVRKETSILVHAGVQNNNGNTELKNTLQDVVQLVATCPQVHWFDDHSRFVHFPGFRRCVCFTRECL